MGFGPMCHICVFPYILDHITILLFLQILYIFYGCLFLFALLLASPAEGFYTQAGFIDISVR